MTKLLFDPKQFQAVELTGKQPKCETIKNISNTSSIHLNCYELGNTIDFLVSESVYTMANITPVIFSLPIPDILSTKVRIEKKRFSKKEFLTIETAKTGFDVKLISYSQFRPD